MRALGQDFETLVGRRTPRRDGPDRATNPVETLTEKVLDELGLEAGVLVAEYGPDQWSRCRR